MYFCRHCHGKLGYQVFEIWILGFWTPGCRALRMWCKFHTCLPMMKSKHHWDQRMPISLQFTVFPCTGQPEPLFIALHVTLAPLSYQGKQWISVRKHSDDYDLCFLTNRQLTWPDTNQLLIGSLRMKIKELHSFLLINSPTVLIVMYDCSHHP